MSNHNNDSGELPQSNPLQIAYEEFVQSTPYITRMISTIQMISYACSWWMNMSSLFATTPYAIWYDGEIYRLLLGPYLVNTNFIPVVIGFYHYTQYGIKCERAIGSTSFLHMCFMIGLMTNLCFCIVCGILYWMTTTTMTLQDPNHDSILLRLSSGGLWNIIFALIANECVQESLLHGNHYSRKLFIWDVPILYYPVALLCTITFLTSSSASLSLFPSIISLMIGYGYGYGKLDSIMKLSLSFIRKVEHPDYNPRFIYTLSKNEGYITSAAAMGGSAWHQPIEDGKRSLSQPQRQPYTLWNRFLPSRNDTVPASTTTTTNGAMKPFASQGRVLGTGSSGSVLLHSGGPSTSDTANYHPNNNNNNSTTQRRIADARAARLLALEKQQQQSQPQDNDPV